MTLLTARQLAVLRLVAEGCSNPEIARRFTSEGRPVVEATVKHQLQGAFARLRARSRAHAIALLDDQSPGWRVASEAGPPSRRTIAAALREWADVLEQSTG